MRYILFLLIAMLQMPLSARGGKADNLLDKVVAGIRASSPLKMDYSYNVFDDDGELVQADKGYIYIDDCRYALMMDNMKVWCDGTTQWSYMKDIDEIYITEADSEEAQNLSPLYIMEHYRKDCDASLTDNGDKSLVTLKIDDEENDIERVELYVSKKETQLVAMLIYMPGQGHIEVLLDGYTPNCGVGDDAFVCPEDDFSSAEIIDMR